MPAVAHVFIHPWLNQEEHWGGLFIHAPAATADCLAHLGNLGRQQEFHTVSHWPWFVCADGDCSAVSDCSWPKDTVFLFSEPESSGEDAAWLAPAKALQQRGLQTGLLANPHHPLPPPGENWNYIFLETSHARTASPIKRDILATKAKLALNGVRNRHDFSWGADNNFSLLSGEFLLMRAKEAPKPDITRLNLLQLLSLVAQDADSAQIEDIFRKEPKLSYSLLRLVNSAAMNLRTPVSSFSQAITLLGRRQLQRWLQLLVYADPGGEQRANPLLQWAAMRGRLMELALPHIANAGNIQSDAAFMTGIFSLLDVLLNLPMEEILAQLPIAEEIKAALNDRSGALGKLLAAIEAADHRKIGTANDLLGSLQIDCGEYARAQLAAIDWSVKVGTAAAQ